MFLWLSKDRRTSVLHWGMELIVVVVGVLLALWAQQWAEGRAERERMNLALDAVHTEARDNMALLMFKQSLDRCLIERETLIRDGLLAPRDDWPGITENAIVYEVVGPLKQNPVHGVMARQGDPLKTAAFRSALTTGALTPLERERLDDLNALYAMFDQINAEEDKGDRSIRTLAALAHPIRLTPEIRAEMLGALYSADRNRFAIQYAFWNGLTSYFRNLDWNDEAFLDREIRTQARDERREGINWRPCKQKLVNPFRAEGS